MLFVDSADVTEIRELVEMGVVCGVTTNPLFLPRTPEIEQSFTLRDIVKAATLEGRDWPVPICVQLTATSVQGMLDEAQALNDQICEELVFKVPFTPDAFRVVRGLYAKNLESNVTSVMSAQQAYLAAQAGADYVSLFYGRIADGGNDPRTTIAATRRLFDQDSAATKIIAGSIRQSADVMSALASGAHIATVKPEILRKMMVHLQTEQVNAEFRAAIEKNDARYKDK